MEVEVDTRVRAVKASLEGTLGRALSGLEEREVGSQVLREESPLSVRVEQAKWTLRENRC